MLCFLGEGENLQKSAEICENLRLGSVCPLGFVPLGAPWSFAGKKQGQTFRPKNSGPKFGRPKFVSQNPSLNSGSGGAKSPVQTFGPESLASTNDDYRDK